MERLVGAPILLPYPFPDSLCSEPRPLFDKDNRIVTCLVGQPRDETYAAAAQHAHDVIIQEGAAADFRPKDKAHRRGDYPVLNVGVTSGLGASTPLTADNKEHTATAQRLLANEYIQRLAIFASGAFLYTFSLGYLQ
jgi:hypothetical protein